MKKHDFNTHDFKGVLWKMGLNDQKSKFESMSADTPSLVWAFVDLSTASLKVC
jgi:hypothetical protein